MNHNPDMNDLSNWLTWWRTRSIEHMKAHRANKHDLFVTAITPMSDDLSEEAQENFKKIREQTWERLNDRHHVVLSVPGIKTRQITSSSSAAASKQAALQAADTVLPLKAVEEFGELVSQSMIDEMVKKLEG